MFYETRRHQLHQGCEIVLGDAMKRECSRALNQVS
jgi:hypothetical protein